MSAEYGRSAEEAALDDARSLGPVVMPKVPLIPVGTIALCVCRKALHVTGHDRRNRAHWSHMSEVPAMHYPSPLGYSHTLSAEEVQIVLLRRENKQLRRAIDSISDLAIGIGRPFHRILDDILAVTNGIEANR